MRWLPAGSLLALSMLLSGCYVLHTARGQMSVMAKRQPIAQVIAKPTTAPVVRTQLERVLEIREFAVRELGLPDNGSYRSYADLKRAYVVWNVFAAPEFSVEPRRWCFPIAGCVAYRGYFDEEKARKFAQRLKGRGDDVSVGGVAAYSTLGHFDDPVLNTMIGWSDVRLAAIIFHELSHQFLYLPGDSSFNEAFASVVEDEGVKRWLERNGREQELEAFQLQRRWHLEFSALLATTREDLRALYASGAPPERMRAAKATEFAELAGAYAAMRGDWNGKGPFDQWFEQGFNNAHLASVATYQQCMPGLERLLADVGGSLPDFYRAARELTRLEPAVRRARVCEEESTPPTR